MKKLFIQKVDQIWAVSSFTQEKMMAEYQLPSDKFKLFPNTFDPFIDFSTDISHDLKQRYGIEKGTNVVLYGNTPSETIAPLMVLQQLGYSNVKTLAVNNSLNQDKLITSSAEVEKKGENINQFIEASVKKVNELLKAKPKPKPVVRKAPVKKVIPKKKKKKMPVEGGC